MLQFSREIVFYGVRKKKEPKIQLKKTNYGSVWPEIVIIHMRTAISLSDEKIANAFAIHIHYKWLCRATWEGRTYFSIRNFYILFIYARFFPLLVPTTNYNLFLV